VNALRAAVACIVILGGFACWAVALASMILAAKSRAPGAPRASVFEGPFDIMYRPSILTPEGQRHRRRCLIAAAGFVLCGLLGALVSMFWKR
jgi:hypothetical protein